MAVVDNLFTLSRFDRSLTTGMSVNARWSQDGFCYSGQARIVKLRRESVEVKLASVAGVNGAHLVGKTLELPRFCDQTRWSSRNCVQPVEQGSLRFL